MGEGAWGTPPPQRRGDKGDIQRDGVTMCQVGDGEFGPYRTGWDQTKSQRLKAQGDELWPDEARRGEAGKGDRRTDAAGRGGGRVGGQGIWR